MHETHLHTQDSTFNIPNSTFLCLILSVHIPANTVNESDLANNLLIASPILHDGCFDKSVVYMIEHALSQGSLGLILNRPTGKSVGDLLSSNDFAKLAKLPVHYGGPVNEDRLHFASFEWTKNKKFQASIQLSSEEAAQALTQSGKIVRAFVGHSGWSEGQLSDELDKHVWFTANTTRTTLTAVQDEHLWQTCLQEISPFHHIISLTPDNPFLN